jgi:hypothetical protein
MCKVAHAFNFFAEIVLGRVRPRARAKLASHMSATVSTARMAVLMLELGKIAQSARRLPKPRTFPCLCCVEDHTTCSPPCWPQMQDKSPPVPRLMLGSSLVTRVPVDVSCLKLSMDYVELCCRIYYLKFHFHKSQLPTMCLMVNARVHRFQCTFLPIVGS